MTPHFNQKTHFPIGLSHNVYPSEQHKWLKWLFWPKKGYFSRNLVTREPFVVCTWLNYNSNQKTQFSIGLSYNVYPSEQQKWLKWPFWPKKVYFSRNSLTHEPLVLCTWLTHHSIQKTHFSIGLSYNVYPS